MVSDIVLGSQTRSFNLVLDHAQEILHKTFGMELVELRSRADLENVGNVNGNEELDEARNATGMKKKGAAPVFFFTSSSAQNLH